MHHDPLDIIAHLEAELLWFTATAERLRAYHALPMPTIARRMAAVYKMWVEFLGPEYYELSTDEARDVFHEWTALCMATRGISNKEKHGGDR